MCCSVAAGEQGNRRREAGSCWSPGGAGGPPVRPHHPTAPCPCRGSEAAQCAVERLTTLAHCAPTPSVPAAQLPGTCWLHSCRAPAGCTAARHLQAHCAAHQSLPAAQLLFTCWLTVHQPKACRPVGLVTCWLYAAWLCLGIWPQSPAAAALKVLTRQ